MPGEPIQADGRLVRADGRRFGRYELLYCFASGGMADIYLARLGGEAGVERYMALKLIHPHLSDEPEFLKMFIDEARLACRISHPNVAITFELGRIGEALFIAMEYVDGESVTSILRRTRPSLPIAARIISDSAAGLHSAHELRGTEGQLLNVVHRDISPSNILVSYQGAVKVVDFGVARAQGSLHITSAGFIGKHGYSAPEQFERGASVDRRTDVFALGVTLWEMTTVRHLFKAGTQAETVERVLRSEIPRPSSIVPGYPPALERIVMKALERSPEKRHQSALELHEELEQFIAASGSPVPSSAIAKMMQAVFADRIKEKHEILRKLPATTGEIRAITDDHPSRSPIPRTGEGSGSGSGQSGPGQSGSGQSVRETSAGFSLKSLNRGQRILLGASAVAGLGALVLAVLVLFAFDNHRGGGTGPGTISGVTPGTTAGTSTRVVTTRPAADSRPRQAEAIAILVSVTPSSATLTFDGKPVDNPFVLRRPPGTGEAELVARAAGHLRQAIRIPLDRGGTFRLKLQRARGPLQATDKKKPPKKDVTESIMDNPYE